MQYGTSPARTLKYSDNNITDVTGKGLKLTIYLIKVTSDIKLQPSKNTPQVVSMVKE